MIKNLLIILSLLTSSLLYGESLTIKEETTIRIMTPIFENGTKYANTIINMANKNKNVDINILLNSAGGNNTEFDFIIKAINIVQSRGIKVNCIITKNTASMGFVLFTECSNRYILDSATLMFHATKLSILGNMYFTQEQLLNFYKNIKKINNEWITSLPLKIGMDLNTFKDAFYSEKIWNATEFKEKCKKDYVNIITDVKGINNIFDYPEQEEASIADKNPLLKFLQGD